LAPDEPAIGQSGVELLLIAGRSGVGKSTVGWEISRQLQETGVAHCFIEGDNLDQIHPAPDGDADRAIISEANLRAVWANYRALGHSRLIYTNTVSVMGSDWMARAIGGEVSFIGVLLTASDETAAERLAGREIGGGLDVHLERSRRAAKWLDTKAPSWVVRVTTDGRSVIEVAAEIVGLSRWPRLQA
jgi:hypothetical protein